MVIDGRELNSCEFRLYKKIYTMPCEERCRLLMKIGEKLTVPPYSNEETCKKPVAFTDSKCNKEIPSLSKDEQSILLFQIAAEFGICSRARKQYK